MAKAIANRLQNVLSKIINGDQTGFLKGRFIGENIRLIDGLINHTAAHNIKAASLITDGQAITSFLKEESDKVALFPLIFSSLVQKY